MGILVTRGRSMDSRFRLTERSKRWIDGIKGQFKAKADCSSGTRRFPSLRSRYSSNAAAVLDANPGRRAMELTFHAISEDRPGPKWQRLFQSLWPAYKQVVAFGWRRGAAELLGLSPGPSSRYMPEFVPVYEELCELAGGSDAAARFISLYGPPAYLSGCSQAIWPGEERLLGAQLPTTVPQAFDALVLRSRWFGRYAVVGTSDCLSGLVDGMNEAGLVASLTFGGRRVVGSEGFGVPIILRYVLETCATAEDAGRTLARIPTHMAYNVTVLDAKGNHVTVYLSPPTARRC